MKTLSISQSSIKTTSLGTVMSKLFLLTGLLIGSSCEDFIKIDPPKDQIVSANVFNSDASAISAVKGIYSSMTSSGGFASGSFLSVTYQVGLSSDELIYYSMLPETSEFYNNSLTAINGNLMNYLWAEPYRYIYDANSILEGIENSKALTLAIRNELQGEAKFIRAFCHFYLVNMFGDVPLVLTTDYRINRNASRVSEAEVNQQIVNDLLDAQELLKDDYTFSDSERIHPNKGAATALLARVYLFMGEWASAEAQATSVINNPNYNLVDVNEVFLKNSLEAIWQLMPVSSVSNTEEGGIFIIDAPSPAQELSSELLSAFEVDDTRRINWVGSFEDEAATYYYPNKYKIKYGNDPLDEYSMVLRLAEQYLIRAEARVKQNDISGAQSDLNSIRNRAGLGNTLAASHDELLLAIEHERQVELFTEWGHRWFDLKRTARAQVVLNALKSDWQDTDLLYPIPQSEMESNINLKPQNPGY